LKNDEEKKRQHAKWRVLKENDIELAKSPTWRPMLGSGGGEGRGDGEGSRRMGREMQSERTTEIGREPGWVPRLTPTRRGDELFLSVQ